MKPNAARSVYAAAFWEFADLLRLSRTAPQTPQPRGAASHRGTYAEQRRHRAHRHRQVGRRRCARARRHLDRQRKDLCDIFVRHALLGRPGDEPRRVARRRACGVLHDGAERGVDARWTSAEDDRDDGDCAHRPRRRWLRDSAHPARDDGRRRRHRRGEVPRTRNAGEGVVPAEQGATCRSDFAEREASKSKPRARASFM